jgi:hypothetical protein
MWTLLVMHSESELEFIQLQLKRVTNEIIASERAAHSEDGVSALGTHVEKSPTVVEGSIVLESSEHDSMEYVPGDSAVLLAAGIRPQLYVVLDCNLRHPRFNAGGDTGRCSCRKCLKSVGQSAGEKLLPHAGLILEPRQSTFRTGCGRFMLSSSELNACLLFCICMKVLRVIRVNKSLCTC